MPIVKTPLEPFGHSVELPRALSFSDFARVFAKNRFSLFRRAPEQANTAASGAAGRRAYHFKPNMGTLRSRRQGTKPRSSGGELVKRVWKELQLESDYFIQPSSRKLGAERNKRPSAIASRLQPRRRSNPIAARQASSWGVMTPRAPARASRSSPILDLQARHAGKLTRVVRDEHATFSEGMARNHRVGAANRRAVFLQILPNARRLLSRNAAPSQHRQARNKLPNHCLVAGPKSAAQHLIVGDDRDHDRAPIRDGSFEPLAYSGRALAQDERTDVRSRACTRSPLASHPAKAILVDEISAVARELVGAPRRRRLEE